MIYFFHSRKNHRPSMGTRTRDIILNASECHKGLLNVLFRMEQMHTCTNDLRTHTYAIMHPSLCGVQKPTCQCSLPKIRRQRNISVE